MHRLRGRVVLVEIWDFTCINCLNTLPYLRAWYERYADHGLEIIGAHTPKFGFARDHGQVKAAVGRSGIRWPVILDNDQAVWTAYSSHDYPSLYLIDHQGYLRYRHIGVGAYAQTESIIKTLLMEIQPDLNLPEVLSPLRPEDVPGAVCSPTTPELYANALGNPELPIATPTHLTTPVDRIDGRFYLDGTWMTIDDGLTLIGESGTITLPYHAASINAVLSPSPDLDLLAHRQDEPMHIAISQDGVPLPGNQFGQDVYIAEGQATVRINAPRLYSLVNNPDVRRHEICLTINKPGLTLYAFSFSSCLAENINN